MAKFSNQFLSYYDAFPKGNAEKNMVFLPIWIWRIWAPIAGKKTDINVFQKTILEFLHIGHQDRQELAQWIGVDIELINLIIDTELVPRGLIQIDLKDKKITLTPKGAQTLDDEIERTEDLQAYYLVQDAITGELWHRLTAKLQQYADLERQLEGLGVLEIQEELSHLREKNREFRIKLSERSEEGLEEENERLEELCDDLESQVFDLRQKNNELESELNNSRLSVMAKHHLQQEKRVLEEHKRVLDTSINQLRTQIDDLVEKQQGELPFKSLSEMDQIFRSEARGLQVVPELQRFVSIMQSNIAKQKFYYSLKDIRLFIAGLAMSKLHLLQGISGTGKTSLARAFAKAINNAMGEDQEKLYCEIVRVQAGWRDREDLLGHFNAFEKRFYTKEALQALYRAQQPKFKDTLQIILLDEMNLSQPEQYFADFLSLMETPDRAEINLLDSANDKAPELFVNKRAIKIPKNVWFIGTANHDETTKEFADKTYDRAHVMEVKRSEEEIDITNANTEQYSFTSLMQSFEQAQNKHKAVVKSIFAQLQNSLLEDALKAVSVSWGNRLERQAYSFIPVYIEMGGSVSEALDHLFATKLFRKGKVTGRYDTRAEKIEDIISCLQEVWSDLGFTGEQPVMSLELLNQDVERLKGNL